MDRKASIALGLAVLLVSGWGVVGALSWPWKAKLFPLVVGIPLLCLAAAELLLSFRKTEGQAEAHVAPPGDVPSELALRRTVLAIGWILGFFAAIVLLGFLAAVPLFVFLYLTVQGRERWPFSALFAAAVSVLFYGLFDALLHMPFPAGWIFEWLGLG